jgi:uncharacterized OB-fold protein
VLVESRWAWVAMSAETEWMGIGFIGEMEWRRDAAPVMFLSKCAQRTYYWPPRRTCSACGAHRCFVGENCKFHPILES